MRGKSFGTRLVRFSLIPNPISGEIPRLSHAMLSDHPEIECSNYQAIRTFICRRFEGHARWPNPHRYL